MTKSGRTLKKIKHLWLFYFLADFAAIALAYYTTVLIRFHSKVGDYFFKLLKLWIDEKISPVPFELECFYLLNAPRLVLLIMATLCVLYALQNLYSGRRFIIRRPVAWKVMIANLYALALFFAYFYLTRNRFHPRAIFLLMMPINVIYCVMFRGIIERILKLLRRKSGYDLCPALVIGYGDEVEFIKELLRIDMPHGIYTVATMQSDPASPVEVFRNEIEKALKEHNVDMIILADNRLPLTHIMTVLDVAGRARVAVKVLSSHLETITVRARMEADMVWGIPFVHFEAPRQPSQLALKIWKYIRAIIALLILIVISPIMFFIAIAIKLSSKGPVFFIQERIGAQNKPFRMYKFRTMRQNAELEQKFLETLNEAGTTVFKIKNDPRVTGIGRFLRRFSIDELPQLINIVRGEMAFVGPRPLPRRDFERYTESWHYLRHGDTAGMTGLWQVSGRSRLGFLDMCILDIYYLRNQTWVLNLKILLKTVWSVIFAYGAY